MKVLIIGDLRIIFTYEFITQILYKIPNVEVDVLNFNSPTSLSLERANEIKKHGGNVFFQPQYRWLRPFRLLWPLIRIREAFRYRIVKQYDLVNIHYIGSDSWVVPHYMNNAQRLIVSIYGSDLLKAGSKMNSVFHSLFERANAITVATETVEKNLSKRFQSKYEKKILRARYGSLAAEQIGRCIRTYAREECKNAFSFPTDKITVLCGYNASPAQKHHEIISALSTIHEKMKERLYLVFHCSYGGSPEYIETIQRALDKSGIAGKIVTDYLQGDQLAMFRKSIDIFLNLQPTDVLSASMIEELEAGAIVIKGEWLMYPDLEKKGAWLCSVSDINALGDKICQILNNYESVRSRTSHNIGMTELLSWDNEFPHWHQALFGVDE